MNFDQHNSKLALDRNVRLPKLIEMLNGGANLQQYADAVGISYRTALRDLALCRTEVQATVSTVLEKWRDSQLEEIAERQDELKQMKEALKTSELPLAEKTELALKIIDRQNDVLEMQSDLLGTKAPVKSLVGMQDLNPPEQKPIEIKFINPAGHTLDGNLTIIDQQLPGGPKELRAGEVTDDEG